MHLDELREAFLPSSDVGDDGNWIKANTRKSSSSSSSSSTGSAGTSKEEGKWALRVSQSQIQIRQLQEDLHEVKEALCEAKHKLEPRTLCMVCVEVERTVVVESCRHLGMCGECADKVMRKDAACCSTCTGQIVGHEVHWATSPMSSVKSVLFLCLAGCGCGE